MANSITLPFSAGVRLLGKSKEPGRAAFEYDRVANKASDQPRRNSRGAALFRHPALLQLEDGSDVIDVTLTTDREEGIGAFNEVSLDAGDARVTVSNQKDSFDVRVAVIGTWAAAKKAS